MRQKKFEFYDTGEPGPPLIVEGRPPQNIVQRLQLRELLNGRRVGTEKYLERSICQSIFPNFTVTSIEKPPCFLRKFTPDGKHFLAFSSDQVSIDIFTYNGPQAAMRLFVVENESEADSDSDWSDSDSDEEGPPPVGINFLRKITANM